MAKVQLDILVNEQAYKDLQRALEQSAKAQERAATIVSKAQGNVSGAFAAAFNPLISNPIGGTGGRNAQGVDPTAHATVPEQIWDGIVKRFGKIAAGAFLAHTAIKTAAETGRNINDPFVNGAQAERNIFRSVVPFGESFTDAVDAISGRLGRMEENRYQHTVALQHISAESRMRSSLLAYMPKQQAAEEYATQTARASAVTTANVDTGTPFSQYKTTATGQVDRSTFGGEREYQERQRLLPVMREMANLDRQSAASARERQQTEGQLYSLASKGKELAKESESIKQRIAYSEMGSGHTGSEYDKLLKRSVELADYRRQNINQQEEAQQAVIAAKRSEAETNRKAAEARAKVHDIRADILENRAEIGAATATTLGAMNPFERARAVEAFKILKETGNPDVLPPQLLQQAIAVGGPEAQKILERHGRSTGEYQQLTQIAPGIAPGDPEALRRQAGEERDQAERERMKAEADFAKVSADAGKDFGKVITSVFKVFVEEAVREVKAQFKIAKNI